jgi:hypothetical protein
MTAQSPNTTMRMQYLATELGYQLQTVNPATPTYTMVKDLDRKSIHPIGIAASASAVKTALSPVDPSIVNST